MSDPSDPELRRSLHAWCRQHEGPTQGFRGVLLIPRAGGTWDAAPVVSDGNSIVIVDSAEEGDDELAAMNALNEQLVSRAGQILGNA